MPASMVFESNFSNYSNLTGDGCNTSFLQFGCTTCPKETTYRTVMGTLGLFIIWPFVVFDMKFFPLGRPAAALAGAAFMVIFTVEPPSQVFGVVGSKGSLQTIFLLLGMMLLSYYYDREGVLRIVALRIFGKNKPFKTILWKVMLLSACLAALITNDATSLLMSPLVLSEHIKQKRSKRELVPLLLGICTSANIGSASTFFGNPQNAYIAANSLGKISLFVFFQTTLPAAVVSIAISIGMMYLLFFPEIFMKEKPGKNAENGNGNGAVEGDKELPKAIETKMDGIGMMTLAGSREDMARGYDGSADPNITSQVTHEKDVMYQVKRSTSHLSIPAAAGVPRSKSMEHPQIVLTVVDVKSNGDANGKPKETEPAVEEIVVDVVKVRGIMERTWREKVFLCILVTISVLVIILLAIPPPPTVTADFNLGIVPLGAGIILMVVDAGLNQKYAFDAIAKVDWGVLLMFMGLFNWLQGFQNTGIPRIIFLAVRQAMNLKSVGGVIFFSIFVVIGCQILSNVPMTILVVQQIANFVCTTGKCEESCSIPIVGLLLAWLTTLSGNITLLGSVTNLIVAEKARSIAGFRLSFFHHMRYGLVATPIIIFTGLPIVYFLSFVAKT
ncbi:hypothetical protein EMCRGX_G004662 [Ephydatia muelleri]